MNKSTEFIFSIPDKISDLKTALQIIGDYQFSAVETAYEHIASYKIDSLDELFDYLPLYSVRNIIPLSVSRSIADQKEAVITGFLNELEKRTDLLDTIEADYFTLDMGIENSVGSEDSEAFRNRISLLARMAPLLYRQSVRLALPVRIPSVLPEPNIAFSEVLKGSLCGKISLIMNIHPHEPAILGQYNELITPFRFYTENISFEFEPETGNTMVTQFVKKWVETLMELNIPERIIFRPRLTSIDSLEECASKLENIINSIG